MRLPEILLSALLASCMAVTATAAEKRTYIYDIAGSDTLRVDVYKGTDTTDKTPALIFAFGGSFRHGQRDDSRYLPMFRFLADNGITVVSADYRTMLSRLEPADIHLNEKIESFDYHGRRVTNFEMESSALAGLAALMGHKAATICTIIAQRIALDACTDYKPFVRKMIQTALDKLATL